MTYALFPVVAVALIDQCGRVLVQKRADKGRDGGKWEFPGGKSEVGESLAAALARELSEELGIHVMEEDFRPIGFATQLQEERQLLLLLFRAFKWSGLPEGLEGQPIAWHEPDSLSDLDMPQVDLDLIPQLVAALKGDELAG